MEAEMKPTERSYRRIEDKDLERLAELAQEDLKRLYKDSSDTIGRYKDRLLMLCLCQGAAKHFIYGRHGVKDFDVWAFFSTSPDLPRFHSRSYKSVDFGPSRFGRHPVDEGFKGRRVDMLRTAIECNDEDPEKCIQKWLREGKSKNALWLAQRPVVIIYPNELLGKVIWDLCAD